MSRRFKDKGSALSYAHPRESRQDADLRRMVKLIRNQQELEMLLQQCKPEMRDRCFQRVEGLLTFKAVNPYRTVP